MDKSIQLFKNPIVRVVTAILLGLFVINIVEYVERLITLIPGVMDMLSWIPRLSGSVSTVVFTVLIILTVNRGKLTDYGFTFGKNIKCIKIVILSFVIGIVTMLVMGIIVNILNSLFPVEGGEHFASKYSFLETVLYVWILASISEEVLTRGLIQGFLTPLKVYGFRIFKRFISVPVLIGALFFGVIHVMLLTTGMNAYMVFAVVITCFILGLMAGYTREKTGSLIPAIIVHMVFNIGGAFLGLLS
jgi:membrane protease YdiL (CAAX protease family)